MTATPKHEVRFILPAGIPIEITRQLEIEIATVCGGFTRTIGHGAWLHPALHMLVEEEIRVYDVAVKRGPQAAKLLGMVKAAALSANEHSLYWRGTDGIVHIIEL